MSIYNYTIAINPFTGQILTDQNTIYVSETGRDSNDGTLNYPVATLSRAFSLYSTTRINIVLRGKITGNHTQTTAVNVYLIGEQDAWIDGLLLSNPNVGVVLSFYFYNIKINSIVYQYSSTTNRVNISMLNVKINDAFKYIISLANANSHSLNINNCIINNFQTNIADNSTNFFLRKNTILNIENYLNVSGSLLNSIIFNIDFYNQLNIWTSYFYLKYCLLTRQNSNLYWNGDIIPITYTTPDNYIQNIIDGLKDYANNVLTVDAQKNYLLNQADLLFREGCIVYDDIEPNARVFLSYDNQNRPKSYGLNMQNGNPALFISDEQDAVGSERPVIEFQYNDNITVVDTITGEDTGETADMLTRDAQGVYFFNINSNQLRNRIFTNVFRLPNGDKLSSLFADFKSAAINGWYFGAWRPIETGITWMDSAEVDFYDNENIRSVFPSTFVGFNRSLEIFYNKNTGNPILYNDLFGLGITTNISLQEYGNYAVSTSCMEAIDLYNHVEVEVKKPYFKFVKLTLTANRTQE